MKIKRILAGLSASLLLSLGVPLAAFAATTNVTPANPDGWSTADTRPGGAVNFINDATAPLGTGALQLTTDATTTSKAQYLHAANIPIADVTELGYATKQNSASFAGGDASFQLIVNLNGAAGGFTTLIYEPYQNGTVIPGSWQTWDVDSGQFWSSRTVTCTNGTGGVTAGGGGAPFYTLSNIKEMCPETVVIGFGANIGSNNPSYDVEVDAFTVNGTTHNFDPNPVPVTVANKEACKNNGWKTSTAPVFKNQGDCVSSFASNGRAGGNPAIANNPTF